MGGSQDSFEAACLVLASSLTPPPPCCSPAHRIQRRGRFDISSTIEVSVSVEDDDQSGARLLQLGPGRKQVWRYYGAEDRMAADIILGVCVRSDRFHRGLRAAAGFLLGCGAGVLGAGNRSGLRA